MSDDILAGLENRGAVLHGHFRFSSGRHGDLYIEKFALLQHPDTTAATCAPVVEAFRGKADVVAGPTTGGVVLAYEYARQLGVRMVIAEKPEGHDGPKREFRRGFKIGPGDRVLVVDDVLTTGGSIKDVIQAVKDRGAVVVGVGVLVDRTGGSVDFGVPFLAALTIEVTSWSPFECPLCEKGEDLTIT